MVNTLTYHSYLFQWLCQVSGRVHVMELIPDPISDHLNAVCMALWGSIETGGSIRSWVNPSICFLVYMSCLLYSCECSLDSAVQQLGGVIGLPQGQDLLREQAKLELGEIFRYTITNI